MQPRSFRPTAGSAARIGESFGLTQANRRWWTLVGTRMGLFVLMLDSTVVNVALALGDKGEVVSLEVS